MANKHMKRCRTSRVIVILQIKTTYVVMQIKTTMRYHYTTIKMVKIQNTDNTKFWQRCGATTTPTHCWWECKIGTATLEYSLVVSYKAKHSLTIWSIVTLLDISPIKLKTYVYTNPSTQIFIDALFIIAKAWKQPSCPSVGEWINKLCYIRKME